MTEKLHKVTISAPVVLAAYQKEHNTTPLIWIRFIDDIFFIWTGSEQDLLRVLNELNSLHPTIKFDMNYSREKIDFLDTTVIITRESSLQTTIYSKPTDRKAYLHAKSYHPKATKDAIPYSQAIRLKRICSEEKDYEAGVKELLDKLE